MRRKKNSALGVKFIPKGGFRTFGRERPDEITNMEGALHTFVTPVVGRCEMVGDYRYNPAFGGHGVSSFGDIEPDGIDRKGRVRLTRSVVMSASVHMDFEGPRVLLQVCKLDNRECVGVNLLADKHWHVLGVDDKQHDQKREEYDALLRRHMIFHLTREGKLPARRNVEAMDLDTALSFLEQAISAGDDVVEHVAGRYTEASNGQVLSLELLFNTAFHQLRNEISALEALCPRGYVYTYDPASIFAREVGPPLLNRLMLAGLRALSDTNAFENMRIFAFNDYADLGILGLVSQALRNQPAVQVLRKEDLFQGPEGTYDVGRFDNASGAMLVVHNNSDGFGQNIETEGDFGSLDGAIGCNSSAAASLARDRDDLLDFVF